MRLRGGVHHKRNGYAFNSLFEMPHSSAAASRCRHSGTFNSLFEMRNGRPRADDRHGSRPFNSLFEMQLLEGEGAVLQVVLFQFSI